MCTGHIWFLVLQGKLIFDMALMTYFLTPATEPKLTIPEKVQEATSGLKVSKAQCPNGIPNRTLKDLPQRAVSLLGQIFNRSSSPINSVQHGSTLE
jgi:hypothetical protein